VLLGKLDGRKNEEKEGRGGLKHPTERRRNYNGGGLG